MMLDSIKVSAFISDALSGIKSATLYYSTDGGSTWTKVAMMSVAGYYEASMPSQMPMTKVMYYVEASDALDNTTNTATQEFTVGIPIWAYGIAAALILILAIFLFTRRRPQPTPTPQPAYPPPPPPPQA